MLALDRWELQYYYAGIARLLSNMSFVRTSRSIKADRCGSSVQLLSMKMIVMLCVRGSCGSTVIDVRECCMLRNRCCGRSRLHQLLDALPYLLGLFNAIQLCIGRKPLEIDIESRNIILSRDYNLVVARFDLSEADASSCFVKRCDKSALPSRTDLQIKPGRSSEACR